MDADEREDRLYTLKNGKRGDPGSSLRPGGMCDVVCLRYTRVHTAQRVESTWLPAAEIPLISNNGSKVDWLQEGRKRDQTIGELSGDRETDQRAPRVRMLSKG